MVLVLLVRHAVTDATGHRLSGQIEGIHLSEAGRQQAEALSHRLKDIPLAAVYSSPLERCFETAEAVAKGRRLEVERLPDVIEVAYGRWTGRPLKSLMRTTMWKQIQGSPSSVRFPDGETLREVQARAVDALEEIAARHPRKAVAVVSHADVIRLVMAHYAGVHLDLFQRLIVSPASVSAIVLGDRVPRIVRMNDTGTLADLLPRVRPPKRRSPKAT